ncbi:MAG: PepSY-associated TM helix domain-containing protein [Pseudomonadota bacterium]
MAKLISKQFRESLTWFHTWLGIGLAAVLFAVFWTGTLTVFDKEIDQWMKPELRIAQPGPVSLDQLVLPKLSEFDPARESEFWMSAPRDRIPAIRVLYEDQDGESHEAMLDPRSGEVLDLTDSHAGSDFFFRFHFMLHMPGIIGYIVVGLAAVGMMALVVSGIFIHRKIIQEFFTFRPQKSRRRSSLDFHNLTAVIALPFHFLLPLSGLFIFASIYFPWSLGLPYDGNARGLNAETSGYEYLAVPAAGQPGPPVERIDALVSTADGIWLAEEGKRSSRADWIGIFNYGDKNSYVIVERYYPDNRVSIGPDQFSFDPTTQEITNRFSPEPVHAAMNWLEGLHWVQFDHWPLRWLYFFAGLSGCAMIGSGMVFWMQARIKKGTEDSVSVRVVRAMSVGAITGIIIASLGFFIGNRLIPKEIDITGVHRHDLEIWVFFLFWALSCVHAALRGREAWKEQNMAIMVLAVVTVVLNWVTTGHHPVAAVSESLWVVLIMDVMILAGGIVAWWVALKMRDASPGTAALRPVIDSPNRSPN